MFFCFLLPFFFSRVMDYCRKGERVQKLKRKKKKTNTNARRLLVDAKVICYDVRHGPGMPGRMSVRS